MALRPPRPATPKAKTKVVKTAVAKKTTVKKPAVKKAAPVEPEIILEDTHPKPPPRTRRRSAVDRLNDPPPASGFELITRVTSAIERELNKIEVIVGGHRIRPSERTESERRARTLASLARTLNEVTRLRSQHAKPEDDEDDAVPRDLDELRETLARRLETLLADPAQSFDREPEQG
jgi:hypothetical protein